MNSSRTMPWLVSALCLLGASVGGYELYLDLTASGHGGLGKPVGKVARREHKVRRKASSSYVWTQVQPLEDLFHKDSIQTGENSGASIELSNGTSLDIGESSLVVMEDTTHLALGFVRGSVVIHKAEGDTRISVGADGKKKVEELPATLLKPESLSRFFVAADSTSFSKQIVFTWSNKTLRSADSPASQEVLQLSTSKRFAPESTKSITPQGGAHIAQMELAPGTYFWRVQTEGVGGSVVRQFRIVPVHPAQTVYPADGQALTTSLPDREVQVRWLNPNAEGPEQISGDHHWVEVAVDASFANVIASQQVRLTNGQAVLKGLQQGQLFWRVRSKFDDVEVTSSVKTFDHNTVPSGTPVAPPPPLPAPETVLPEDGAKLSLLDEKVQKQASWSSVEGAGGYEVSLFKGEKEISHLRIKETAVSLKNLGPGEYSWTVRAVGERGPGEGTARRTFAITYGEPLAAPQVLSPEVQ